MRDRPQYLPDLRRTRWIIFVPGRGQARRRGANDAHGYRRPGHPPHERSELADQPSSTPAPAIWLRRHDAGDPPSPGGPGDRLVRGRASWRHGGETPAAWVQASRTPLGRPSPSPAAGAGEGGGTPARRVGSGCPAVRGQPRDSKLLYTPSWAAGRASPPENAYPRQIVRAGWTGSSARDGLAPLTPASPRRAAAGGMAWPSMICISTSRSATATARSPPPR